VRIVAATNKNLEAECEAGRFRQDLFFRLNVIPIHVPALRERVGDAPLLLNHFLKLLGAGRPEFQGDALEFLNTYPWPGNIRELRNLAERIAVMYPEGKIDGKTLEELLRTPGGDAGRSGLSAQGEGLREAGGGPAADILEKPYNEAKESFERYYLEFHLARNNGIISRTAEAIGIYPSNLHSKLRKYHIAVNPTNGLNGRNER
jgi:two-component system nitrogen regulation response regulator NtrX